MTRMNAPATRESTARYGVSSAPSIDAVAPSATNTIARPATNRMLGTRTSARRGRPSPSSAGVKPVMNAM